MSSAMRVCDHFVQDEQFCDDEICASRVHLGNIGMKSSPASQGDLRVWIEGEAYNSEKVTRQLGLEGRDFASQICSAYECHKLDGFLNQLDGYFCAAIYDIKSKQVSIISDRYGLRMLYWYCKDGVFAWASEVKGILTVDGIDKTPDPTALGCFFDLGYFVGEHTWFEQIKLIKPASVVQYDINDGKLCHRHYWSWSEIGTSGISFEDAADEMGERFIAGVNQRFDPNQKIGISLSGGLDSRAIFAAANQLHPDYEGSAYTFGKPGCSDIKIA